MIPAFAEHFPLKTTLRRFGVACALALVGGLLAFGSTIARGAEPAVASVNSALIVEHLQTTSDFRMHGAGARANRRFGQGNWDLGVLGMFQSGDSGQQKLRTRSGQLTLQWVSEGWHLAGSVGATAVETSRTRTFAEGGLRVERTFANRWYAQAIARREFFGHLMQTRGAYEAGLTSASYQVSLTPRLGERVRVGLMQRQLFFSDSNRRGQQDLSVFYGLSTGSPWIWVGAGVENLSHHRASADYWSPVRFLTYGPRLDLAMPVSSVVSLATGLNVNRFHERGLGGGLGYYLNSRVVWKITSRAELSAAFESILSQQNSRRWNSQGIHGEAQWTF